MFNTIVILSSPGEVEILATALRQHAPHKEFVGVTILDDLLALPSDLPAKARLIAFTTSVIVPADLLQRFAYGGYNFHPGPPTFPGLAPAQFAIYQGATLFGATAHRMTPRVDEGPIVGFELFPTLGTESVAGLEIKAYSLLAKIFARLAPHLAGQEAPIVELPVTWSASKSNRRWYSALCEIAPDIGEQELRRRIRAFGGGHFGMMPHVTLFGYEFRLVA